MLICTVSQTEHDRLSVQISQLQTKHTNVTGAQCIDTSPGEIENLAQETVIITRIVLMYSVHIHVVYVILFNMS